MIYYDLRCIFLNKGVLGSLYVLRVKPRIGDSTCASSLRNALLDGKVLVRNAS